MNAEMTVTDEMEDGLAPESCACPMCTNREMDGLLWDDNGEWLTCDVCGWRYKPMAT
jgi:hypothetical protein